MSYGVGPRCGLDLALLWLWRRPVVTALIQPLAWELPCAMGAALKKEKKKNVARTQACSCSSDLTPSLGIPYAAGAAIKRKKKKD